MFYLTKVIHAECTLLYNTEGTKTNTQTIYCIFFYKYFADHASQYIYLLISTNSMH